ncbi:MAG TPA: peptidase M23 [Clostridiales bacterium]|nr:peptidase M23 [Clostridiales bacterium]
MSKRLMRIVVALLACSMLLTALLPALTVLAEGASVTKDEIAEIKDELSQIAQQKKEVEQELSQINREVTQAEDQIALVQGKIALTEQEIAASQRLLDEYDSQIAASQQLIDQYDGEIAAKQAEITRLEEEEQAQYQEFYSQVRWMEETGPVSYLSIFFQASSFSELLDYAMLVTDIMEYSNRIVKRLEATQEEIGQAKQALEATRESQAQAQQALEQTRAGQAAAHTALQSQKSELESQKQQAQSLYTALASSQAEVASKAKQLAADEAAMASELKEAEAKYAAQIANQNNTGSYQWPLPGYYSLSSRFGYRISPISGRPESHGGNDIPAPGGTSILAAQGGVVTVAKYNVSYGYYCIINHGGGKSTLYAHMRSMPAVQAGQTVQKGQVVGYVGTTGDSTGNHLHFELRINGSRADALQLYPGMTFKWQGTTVQGG